MRLARTGLVTIAAAAFLLVPSMVAFAADDIVVDGAGWGHGIGMSQYGAYGQASEGKTAEEILAHYYTGTAVASLDSVVPGSYLIGDPEPLWVSIAYRKTTSEVTAKAGALTFCQNEPDELRLHLGSEPSHWIYLLESSLVVTGHFPDTPDETFDAATDAAVRAFQSDNGLAVDGWAGPDTRSVLWPTDEHGENCTLEVPLGQDVSTQVTAIGDGTCQIGSAPAAGSCYGSVDGLTTSARLAVSGKIYDGYTTEYAHGVIRLRPRDSTQFHISLQIGIEDYIAGIAEVFSSWPDEALRAQAIAARSYALERAHALGPESSLNSTIKDKCWCHVYSTTLSQVYQGYNREIVYGGRWAAQAATTAGLIVTHPSKAIVPTFYSSSTGGFTEDNDDAWGGAPLPYLRSVDDHWSQDSVNPNDSWTVVVSPEQMAGKFDFSTIHRVQVTETNTSGSARTVEISGVDDEGIRTTSYTSGTVKSELGLKSIYFDIDWTGDDPGPQPEPAATDSPVLHDPTTGRWTYRDVEGALSTIYYGVPGDLGFFGDWDCDGVDTPGLYRQSDGYVYLRNSNTQGVADISYFFGIPGDVAIAGDFNGDGCDTVSIYRPSEARFYIINELGSADGGLGAADFSFLFGVPGDVPFVGDWDGDGIDTPGLRRSSNGFVYLRDSNSQGVADVDFFYGISGDVVFAGDWDGDGDDSLGLYRPSNGTVYLRNTNTTGIAEHYFVIGQGLYPVAGEF